MRSPQRTLLTALLDGLRGSRYWRRAAGRDHLFAVSSTRPLEDVFKHAWPLVRGSILLKAELGSRRRHRTMKLPEVFW